MPITTSRRGARALTVLAAAATAALTVVTTPARAQSPFSSIAFFGDSFLDAGNFDALTRSFTFGLFGFPPPPYVQGRFSNGPTWAEYFAAQLGRPNDGVASRLGGQNYAYGGATTGTVNVNFRNPLLTDAVDAVRASVGAPALDWSALAANGFGLQNQVQDFAAVHPSGNAGTLAVLLAGGNDFINDLDPDPRVTIARAVTNMVGAATVLYGTGVRSFLVPSLPDLALTPRGRSLPPAQAAGLSAIVGAYNGLLAGAFTQFASTTGANYFGLHLDTLFANILAQPNGYGFTNTTAPCLFTGAPCATSVFADDIHPTTHAHALIAQAAYNRVVNGADVSAVPEPATFALVGGGLAGLAAFRRRRARGAAA